MAYSVSFRCDNAKREWNLQIFILNIKLACECFASAIEGNGQSNDTKYCYFYVNGNKALENERQNDCNKIIIDQKPKPG